VYNAGNFLERCLDSLKAQTLREIEIICVDDGCTDCSPEILRRYAEADKRFKIFRQKNAGPGAARNTALANAHGKYVLFCDADDTLEAEAAKDCAEVMEREGVDAVLFNAQIIEEGRTDAFKKNPQGEYILTIKKNNTGILGKFAFINSILLPNTWGYIFRTDLINRYNIRFPSWNFYEDWVFILSYFLVSKSGYGLQKTYYQYFIHTNSLMGKLNNQSWFASFIKAALKVFKSTFIFSLRNKIFWKEIYVLYWFFMYGIKRILWVKRGKLS